MFEEKRFGFQSSISRSEDTESVEYGDEARGVEETKGLGDDGRKTGEVMDMDGAWEGRLCEEVGRVQKPPSEVAATADEESTRIGGGESGSRSTMGRRERAGNRWRGGSNKPTEGTPLRLS